MEQTKIIEALQKALANGSGSLDDLDNLLTRAKKDIAEAKEMQKKQEEAAKAKTGAAVAELATRLLNGETTADDAAYVLNTWSAAQGYPCKFKGKDLDEIVGKANAQVKDVTDEFEQLIDNFCDTLLKWGEKYNFEKPKCEKPKKEDNKKPADADSVINDFLKSFGLR